MQSEILLVTRVTFEIKKSLTMEFLLESCFSHSKMSSIGRAVTANTLAAQRQPGSRVAWPGRLAEGGLGIVQKKRAKKKRGSLNDLIKVSVAMRADVSSFIDRDVVSVCRS